MPAHIEQIDRQAVGIDLMVTKTVAAQLGRWHKMPVGAWNLNAARRQNSHDVLLGLRQFLIQAALSLLQEDVALRQLILDRLAMLNRPLVEHLQIIQFAIQAGDFGAGCDDFGQQIPLGGSGWIGWIGWVSHAVL